MPSTPALGTCRTNIPGAKALIRQGKMERGWRGMHESGVKRGGGEWARVTPVSRR